MSLQAPKDDHCFSWRYVRYHPVGWLLLISFPNQERGETRVCNLLPHLSESSGILLVTCKESKFKGYKKGIRKRNYERNVYSSRASTFLNWITPHLELLELQTSLETNLGLMINCVLCSKKFYLLIHSKRHTLRPFNQPVGRRFRRKLYKTHGENYMKFIRIGRRRFKQGFCWVTNMICSSLDMITK